MNSTADHDVLKLARLYQLADLTLGDPNTRRKLLWRLQPLICLT
jgi:hypothetical protein